MSDTSNNTPMQTIDIDLLLVTALTEEAQVVEAVLTQVATWVNEEGPCRLYDYQAGMERTCRIATASAHQMGAVGMGVFTTPLLEKLRPRSAVLVGIAAAVDTTQVELGDVPFASQVLSFDDISVANDGALTFRTQGFQVDPAMRIAVGGLRLSPATYGPWQKECLRVIEKVVAALNLLRRPQIKPPVLSEPPHIVVEAVAGGPFLLRDKDFRDTLTKGSSLPKSSGIRVTAPVHPKLVSAEMESHGFMRAAHEHGVHGHGVPATVLKGISDVGDADKAKLEEKTGGFYRAYACSNAVLAILHILKLRADLGTNRIPSQSGVSPHRHDGKIPDGWTLVDEAFLAEQRRPLNDYELNLYFDGAVPVWRHVLSSEIPQRDLVGQLVQDIEGHRKQGAGPLFELLLGAGGEGKSTALLQVAVALAGCPEWRVLWRTDPEQKLSTQQLDLLQNSGLHWLLVADDADTLVHPMLEIAKFIHRTGAANIHLLACARDTDWIAAGGPRQPWSFFCALQTRYLRGLGLGEAERIVRSWNEHRRDGREFRGSIASQAAALAAAASGDMREGSFFGGVLQARFSPEGLLAHISDLMRRLEGRPAGDKGHTLLDAFMYVSSCHAIGIPGLDNLVLADLLGVNPGSVRTAVEHPLGEEAGAVRAGRALLTRHRRVAEGALVVADRDFGHNLGECFGAIIQQTIETGRENPIQFYSEIVHCSSRLANNLPTQIPLAHRLETAVSAATCATKSSPRRLSYLMDLAAALAAAEDFKARLELFRNTKPTKDAYDDFSDVAAGFYQNWASSEGAADQSHDRADRRGPAHDLPGSHQPRPAVGAQQRGWSHGGVRAAARLDHRVPHRVRHPDRHRGPLGAAPRDRLLHHPRRRAVGVHPGQHRARGLQARRHARAPRGLGAGLPDPGARVGAGIRARVHPRDDALRSGGRAHQHARLPEPRQDAGDLHQGRRRRADEGQDLSRVGGGLRAALTPMRPAARGGPGRSANRTAGTTRAAS